MASLAELGTAVQEAPPGVVPFVDFDSLMRRPLKNGAVVDSHLVLHGDNPFRVDLSDRVTSFNENGSVHLVEPLKGTPDRPVLSWSSIGPDGYIGIVNVIEFKPEIKGLIPIFEAASLATSIREAGSAKLL